MQCFARGRWAKPRLPVFLPWTKQSFADFGMTKRELGHEGKARSFFSGERDFESFADAFRQETADFGVARDRLDEAVGRIDPDRMPPAFAFQHAALLLQVADEVAAFHAVNEHSGRFFLQGKSPEDVEK